MGRNKRKRRARTAERGRASERRPPSRLPTRALATMVALFGLVRLVQCGLVEGHDPSPDMRLYTVLAAEARDSLREGDSFYARHRRNNAQYGEARALVEYPPLAVAFITLPSYPAWRDPSVKKSFQTLVSSYRTWMRALLFVCDLACFVLLVFASLWLVPAVSPQRHFWVWGGYLAATFFQHQLLYERLDVVLGALLLGSAVALLRRRSTLAYALLAVGVSFKLIPLALLPAWILLDLRWRSEGKGRPLAALAGDALGKGAIFAGALLVINGPFLLREGIEVFGFLRYHGMRGVQVESTYSSLIMLAQYVGLDVRVQLVFGAWHVLSAWSDGLAAASLLLGAAATLVLLYAVVRPFAPHLSGSDGNGAQVTAEGARRPVDEAPELFLIYVAATLVSLLATAKVFSPQYLLWLLPVVFLLPDRKPCNLVLATLVGVSALTMVIYPYQYSTDILGPVINDAERLRMGSTAFGTLLLVLRNGLVVAAAVWLGQAVWQGSGLAGSYRAKSATPRSC